MSVFWGIYNRNGNEIDQKIFKTMSKEGIRWNPDTIGEKIDRPIALGHAMLWNTLESKYESLPLKKEVYILTMDARIDNRNELAKEIKLPDIPLSEVGDSEFILGAYEKWGEECPKYLLGDFSFVIWDEVKHQLFCARDHVGIKQFYYYSNADFFVFSNDLKTLMSHKDIPKSIENESMAAYIHKRELEKEELTFFENVYKLSPAHSLKVSSEQIYKKCYWKPKDTSFEELKNENAYIEKLDELLNQSIQDRMRTIYPMASHLSGGLDSSLVSVLVARKLNKSQKLLTFNWLQKPKNKEEAQKSEWFKSKHIADLENMEHHYVDLSEEKVFELLQEPVIYGNTAAYWYEYHIRDQVEKSGGRIIFSGWGGDELISSHGMGYIPDLLSQGNFIQVAKELKNHVGINPKRFVNAFYYGIFIPFVPRTIYNRFLKCNCEKAKKYIFVKEEFLTILQEELKRIPKISFQPYTTMKKQKSAYLQQGHLQARIEAWFTAALDMHIEYVYPLLDKRIIEFALNLPAKYAVKNDEGRYLFRLISEHYLPREIVWSKEKGEPSRVERLIDLSYAASKRFIEESRTKQIFLDSKYIDLNKILSMIHKKEKLSIEELTQLETAIALLQIE